MKNNSTLTRSRPTLIPDLRGISRVAKGLPLRAEKAVRELAKKYRVSVLLKGGHLAGSAAVDLLFAGNKLTEFSAPFVRGVATHGTGCTYSAAITAGLASGLSLEDAICRAKKFVTQSIRGRFRWTLRSGKAFDALNHSP